MVVGRTPFEGESLQALLAKHVTDIAPNLRTIDPDIPLFLERAVSRALAKEPAERFDTPNDFAATLTSETVVPRVGRRRLAVLPPINLMNEPEQEYFVQGMHNALISELQRAGVAVIARTSVLQYQNTQKPVRQIAGELGVDVLIEPSVFRAAGRVELEVRLVDGGTEEYLTGPIARSGEFGNVVALYRDLTRAIAAEIRATVTPQVEARLSSARPVNPDAYDAFLKGQFHWYRLTERDLDTALGYFELARKIDPNYAPAFAGIAMVWAARMQGLLPYREALPRVRAAVARAQELDSTLVEVQHTLAIVSSWHEWDWETSGEAYQRAIAINPNFPDTRAFYSHFLYVAGRPDEAMEQIERARELDPFNSLFQTMHAMGFHYARRYDDALALLRNTLATNPDDLTALAALRTNYHLLGRFDDALEVWKTSMAATGDREAEAVLARGSAEGGYVGALTSLAEMLIERSCTSHVTPWRIATLYTRAGRQNEALHWLGQAYEIHDVNMPYIGVDPIFDGLRDDRRFQDLLLRMNLPR
jgi:TolB-like protein/Tfp pilus assembly protein PilF